MWKNYILYIIIVIVENKEEDEQINKEAYGLQKKLKGKESPKVIISEGFLIKSKRTVVLALKKEKEKKLIE